MPDKEFKGYICKRCRNYVRVYREKHEPYFSGRCTKCNSEIILQAEKDDQSIPKHLLKKEETINIWDSYSGGKIIGTLVAGTFAKRLQTVKYNGVDWYRIQAGKLIGWVSGSFIRKLKQ